MRAITMSFLVSLVVTTSVMAADYADLYVIPIAGHAQGAFGTAWRSDIVIHNFQDVPITVEMALVETGRSASTPPIDLPSVDVAPGETKVIEDAARQEGRDGTGAILIGATLPFAVTSRAYSGPTVGQTVLPIAIAGDADAVSNVAVLPGLAQTSRQRSNVGLFIASTRAPLVAEIALVSASGASLGSQLVVIDGEGLAQRQFAAADSGAVTAIVRILDGDGIIVPYASVIDNESAAAMFIPAAPATSGGSSARMLMKAAVSGISR